MKSLITSLTAVGHPPIELEAPGGSLLVLPYGGRVLGLFSHSEENFFWVNPNLTQSVTATAFFATEGWKNSGGDRTWVAPEAELSIPDIDNPWETYTVPPSLDPGNYAVQQEKAEITLTNRAEVVLHRQEKTCEIELEKTIRMTENPLRYEKDALPLHNRLEFVGYEQLTSLRFSSPPEPGIHLGIWNLIQVPTGGEIIIPTVRKSPPRNYFGNTGPHRLHVTSMFIHFRVDATERHKIGVRASSTIGRMGYLRSIEGGKKTLVIRNFFAAPSGEYVDVPWDDPNDRGYAIQCYNDDGEQGQFGEMEYHTPAIGDGTGLTSYQDRSQVWAFLGEEQSVDEVFKYLFGTDNMSPFV